MSKLADAVRFLAMDAIQKANSGHPGAPMGMAEMAEVLWTQFLKFNPKNPAFADRDRFVLSNGHASMLQYALLHLTGFDVSIDDIKNFRQMGSKTPGHPEYGYTAGVETTTGPLGQGFANAVGFALAEKILAAEFNRGDLAIVNHHTFVFLGDGCLMEGISHEAASLAGSLGLGKLIALYDDNGITIDGTTVGRFDENIPQRFESYGWQAIVVNDGHNTEEIAAAIEQAKADTLRPTIICCKTTIGKGAASKAGSHKVHGSPLGAEEIAATRQALGWDYAPFDIPADIYAAWDCRAKGEKIENEWQNLFNQYKSQYPELAAEFTRRVIENRLPENFANHIQAALNDICHKKENIATRKASQNAIAILAEVLPELVGGSADLTPSNLTDWKNAVAVTKTSGGNYVHYGVREFAMCAVMNGLALHGGVKPFGATFLMFSEYARNALRMAALMKINPIFVFTHDSIGLGEDGPTHQPIEQIATLRQIPNMHTWRPCDTAESLIAWAAAAENQKTPSCLIFRRQNLPFIERNAEQLENVKKGGYVLSACGEKPQIVLIATGSEVALALNAQKALQEQGINASVVSMPCTNLFDAQSPEYRTSVLPDNVPRLAIEAGVSDFWRKYVGLNGGVIGIDTFGESAPADTLFKHFGFTVENVVEKAKALVK
ncbi:MAG: transketolase [Neisseriaceae bacterium]|nr:transketolase [Neisseriaceae bacterium]